MREPVVEVFAEGEPPRERAVGPEGLRIGRLGENEIVLGTRAVSRRHAALRVDGARLLLEDAGSENGSYVNGARVEHPVVLQPGDELRIGPHRLVVRDGFRRGSAPVPGATPRDGAGAGGPSAEARAAEEASTLAPRGGEAAPAAAAAGAGPAAPADDLPAMVGGPEPGDARAAEAAGSTAPGDGAAKEGELWLDAPADGDGLSIDPADFDVMPEEAGGSGLEAAEPPSPEGARERPHGSLGPEAPGPGEAEGPAGVPEADLPAAHSGPAGAPALAAPEGDAAPAAPRPGPDGLYAGFVVQREGRLEGVVSWEGDRLVAGRGSECEIVLDRPEVSREHALFVREEGRYEVRDAGSSNGTRVNGEPVERRRLEVGDVVEIDRFALTFLLDAQPVESVVQAAAPASASAEAGVEETRFAGPGAEEALGASPAPFGDAPPARAGSAREAPGAEAPAAGRAEPAEGALPPSGPGETLPGAADAIAAEEGAAFAPGSAAGAETEEDEEKELEDARALFDDGLAELSVEAPEVRAPARAAAAEAPPLRLELALDAAELPEPLREALRALGGGPLRVPVELRVRGGEEGR